MSKLTRTIHLALFITILISLNWTITGRFEIPSGESSIWFHSGLLMLVIGLYWVEPFFTKPADVVINSLVVFIAVSTLNNPPLYEWWSSLQYLSIALGIFAFVVIVFGNPTSNSVPFTFLYTLLTRLGSSRVIFSAVFLLSLLTYFDLTKPTTKYFAITWFIILLSRDLKIDKLIDILISKSRVKRNIIIGVISGYFEPNIIRFHLNKNSDCQKGTFVAFTKNGLLNSTSPIGFVSTYRRRILGFEVECILIDSEFRPDKFDERHDVIKIDIDHPNIANRLIGNIYFNQLNQQIGYTYKDSNITRLFIELTNSLALEEGYLVKVLMRNVEVFYQITSAALKEESAADGCQRSYIQAVATQLGIWNPNSMGFETYAWVAPENAPVFRLSEQDRVIIHNEGLLESIGHIPNSSIPVGLNLNDLILYHTAILGVTGAGKSFLAYELIEKVASSGTKVICLDITGDYKRHLHNSVILSNPRLVRDFLDNSKEFNIGIVEFTENSHPIISTEKIASYMLNWCREHRTDDDFINPKPKVLLVLEEAHNLVPEWNFNPDRSLQDQVTKIAQVVLQARKYGLGICLITQRTANVTKSILNQCNTIFSFQAFDETGYEFLKNYMGEDYINALPNLKKQHGILVGKGSNSRKPLIVRFNDQVRVLNSEPPSFLERRDIILRH